MRRAPERLPERRLRVWGRAMGEIPRARIAERATPLRLASLLHRALSAGTSLSPQLARANHRAAEGLQGESDPAAGSSGWAGATAASDRADKGVCSIEQPCLDWPRCRLDHGRPHKLLERSGSELTDF